jgi:uncharacterized NAD(P)/FAD-binding protein YdhS
MRPPPAATRQQPPPAPEPEAPTIVIVGAGPGATGLLERLAANLPGLAPDRPLRIHVVDPYQPGAGRVWRDEQSPLLWMNSMAEDVTMFTDDSVQCAGPIRPGPSLLEWAQRQREALPAVPSDPAGVASPSNVDELDVELARLTGRSFPSRRLQTRYLAWVFQRAVAALGPAASVEVHAATVLDVTDDAGGRQRVRLAGGGSLLADVVVLALGHLDSEVPGGDAELHRFATARKLVYRPCEYTADADLTGIRAGQPVLVRGLGLAFIDLMVLLTEGRGGRFSRGARGAGQLVYHPSGAEPRLYAGSRRGVPYHAKIGYPLPGRRPPLPRFLDDAAVAALRAAPYRLDLRRDVWPLVAKEIGWGYYHELFASHPDRVRLDWPEFAARYAAQAWYEPATAALVAEAVPDPADRLDLEVLDRPLVGRIPAGIPALQAVVRAHVRADIDRRSNPAHSADLGAFLALLTLVGQLAGLADRLTARSRVADLDGWWHGFFSFFASGPPPYRLQQLLALSEAGILTFLGPDLTVEADPVRGVFRAGPAGSTDHVGASALVEARLPAPNVRLARSPLLRSLYDRGAISEEQLTDADQTRVDGLIRTGRVRITADGQVLDRTGTPHPRRFALGAFTTGRAFGAFARPHTNAPSFRQNDRTARAILAALPAPQAPAGRRSTMAAGG